MERYFKKMAIESTSHSSPYSSTPSQSVGAVKLEAVIIENAGGDNEFDKRRSWVWPEYIKIKGSSFLDGKKRATCKHCKKHTYIAESSYGTSNFAKHLKKCASFQANKRVGFDGPSHGTSNLSNHLNKCPSFPEFDEDVYRELVAKAIIQHGYGFSWAEHEGNMEILGYLNNRAPIITKAIAESECLRLHAELKKELKDTLLSLPGRICLTSDLWTACNTDDYLCLTAHYVDSDWKFKSRILNFRLIPPPLIGSIISDTVFDLLREWGIQHKLFSITVGDASRNDSMQDDLKFKLMEKGLLLGTGQYFHVPCAAHTLNLIVEDVLKAVDDCVSKVRESVKYVEGSEVFRECVEQAMIRETKTLWLDVPTRWNSTYFLLDRALLYRRAFEEFSKTDPDYNPFPNDDEWDRIARVHKLLAPFYAISGTFSGSQYPTANLYFENLWKVDMLMKEQMESSDQVIRDMVVEMRAKFDKYWTDYSLLFAFAVVLDPRRKLAYLTSCYEKLYGDKQRAASKAVEVQLKLEVLLMEYTKSKCTNQGTLESPPCKRKSSFSEECDEKNNTLGPSTVLDAYLEDPTLDCKQDLDVLSFWKLNQDKYRELALLARDVLSVPLTTIASGSTFSIGGRILSKWKDRCIPQNVEALIATRSWLYGFESNGDEEFTGSYVKWMSSKSTRRPMH